MPIPKPHSGESQDDFMGRCMEAIADEYDDHDQAVAVCMTQWKERAMTVEIEKRAFPIEFRVEGDESPKISGYAAVFNRLSDNLGGFREKIAPGAFRKTLKEADVRALFNHDPNFVLGRTKSGTLALKEDDRGLAMDIEPPDTVWARDLLTTIGRGDVDQASFAFRVVKDSWKYPDGADGKEQVRTLEEVQLFDVSPVTYPAYSQTAVDVRSVLVDAGIDWHALMGVVARVSRGLDPSDDDKTAMTTAITVLQAYLPEPESHSGESEPEVHSDAEPVEATPFIPRKISALAKEWRLEMETGA